MASTRGLVRTGALGFAVVGFVILAQQLDPSPSQPGAPERYSVREATSFETITEMTWASDAIINGTVLAVEPGRTMPLEAGGLQFFDVRVRVDSLEAGTLSEREIILEIDSVVFPGVGRADGVWPVVGTPTILFLHRKLDVPSKFRPISSQGAFTVRGEELVAANPASALAAGIEKLTEADLLQTIRASRN